MRLLSGIGRLYTSTGAAPVEAAAVVLDGDRITWVGRASPGPPAPVASAITEGEDLGGALVTPGLVDAHTHPVYTGNRHQEIARRSASSA